MGGLVLRTEVDGICTISLNRPEHLNAVNLALFRELEEHVSFIEEQSKEIVCVILTGTGRSFCAGADLKDRETGDAIVAARAFKGGIVKRLGTLAPPMLAAVRGHCLTGGLELALAADLIVAEESAIFADTHGKWGLVSSWGMSQRLPRRIGVSKAKEMMFTSRRYSGRQAEAMGLVDLCVPDGTLDISVMGLAREIAANSGHTNRSYKRLITETESLPLAAGLAWEFQNHPGSAPDVQARIASFRKG